MSENQFKDYMEYQILFLKENQLWENRWLCKNSKIIGYLMKQLYLAKNGDLKIKGLLEK